MGRSVDKTLEQNGCWQTAVFTVPAEVSDDRVQFSASKYKQRFGDTLEAQGWTVLAMNEPVLDTRKRVGGTAPDRRPYMVSAWCRRAPQQIKVDIPDHAVPDMKNMGLALAE